MCRFNLKTNLLVAACLFACAAAAPVQGQSSDVGDGSGSILETVKISGFADLLASVNNPYGAAEPVRIGQAEVGLSAGLASDLTAELAIVHEEDRFTIGALTAEFMVSTAGFRAADNFGVQAVRIGAGQFDVPIGLDYEVYPSFDRKLVSTPMAVDRTHGCWNGMGAYAWVDASWGNVSLFTANGYCHEGFHEGDEHGEVQSVAAGGRSHVYLVDQLAVGVTYARIEYAETDQAVDLSGAHIEFAYSFLSGKGEFLSYGADDGNAGSGYYAQLMASSEAYFATVRYGAFAYDADPSDRPSRLTAGIGRALAERAELRLEQQVWLDGGADETTLQLAVSF